MRYQADKLIEELLARSKDIATDLEPWPNYFRSKTNEFKTILNFYDFGRAHNVLEIGCGNGYTAALLSANADRVTAFDLPFKSAGSHSMGITAAGELINRLGVKNVRIVGGSAGKLPFPDKFYDVVFSEYVLQYVRRKDSALAEIHRVLNDNGVVITVVPNFVERLVTPFIKYKYIIKKVFSSWLPRYGSDKADTKEKSVITSFCDKRPANKLSGLEDWVLLRPDGAYKSFMEEMIKHVPFFWTKLFEKNAFKVIGTFSTELLPLELFGVLGHNVKSFISKRAYNLNISLGGKPIIKNLGYSYGIIAKKARP